MRYRKKPVVIEAIQLHETENEKLFQWMDPSRGNQYDMPMVNYEMCWWKPKGSDDFRLMIPTLEGEMEATPGDWIIKGISGEFYPCKNEIFQKTYEAVE